MTITDFGVAIVPGDTHLSKWVLEHRRLDIQDTYCRLFQQYIPEGGTVIDVGACIGDHTLSYAKMVGPGGQVHAFEPNPVAFECLEYNMERLPQVTCRNRALGAAMTNASIIQDHTQNLGAARIEADANGPVLMMTLNGYHSVIWPDFIKIDAEGFEPDIIAGAMETLKTFRPVLLIEVNRPVLAVRGKTAEDIFRPLQSLGYTIQPSEPHLELSRETLDVLCLP